MHVVRYPSSLCGAANGVKRKFIPTDDTIHHTFCRTAGIEFEKIIRKDKTVVMTGADSSYQVHHIFIDENGTPTMECYCPGQGYYLDLSFVYVDKLQILVPVHNLKSRISRITVIVRNVQHQIGKIALPIQIDRIDISVSYSAPPF